MKTEGSCGQRGRLINKVDWSLLITLACPFDLFTDFFDPLLSWFPLLKSQVI